MHFKMINQDKVVKYKDTVIDYIPHTVYFIPVSRVYCNWKFVLLNLFYLFLSSPNPLCSVNHLFTLCIYNRFSFVIFVHLLCFLDSTYKSHSIYLSLSNLIPLNIIPYMSIHVVLNGKISFSLMTK